MDDARGGLRGAAGLVGGQMMNRWLLWLMPLLVGIFFGLSSGVAKAETCSGATCTQPATYTTTAPTQKWRYCWGAGCQPTATYDTGALAAKAIISTRSYPYSGGPGTFQGTAYTESSCVNSAFVHGSMVYGKFLLSSGSTTCYGIGDTVEAQNVCTSGTLSGGQCINVPTCPSGYTLSGTTCSRPNCKPGQYLQDGVCKCDNGSQTGTDGSCCPAPGAGGGAPMQWCYVDSAAATSCASAGQNGCAVRCNNVTYQAGTGDQVNIFPKQALGQACGYTGLKTPADSPGGGEMTGEQLQEVAEATKDPEKAKTPEGCLAAGMGYVTSGGVTSCVSSGEGGQVKQTESGKVTDTVKNPTTGENETTTTETEKSETTNGDGTKTGTTSETVTNPNGTKTITTTTKTQNPDGTVTETIKKETVAADGTKTTTGEKTGTEAAGTWCQKNPSDPICKKESDECKLFPERASCMDAGTAPEEGELPSVEHGVSSLTLPSVSSSPNCPSGATLPRGLGVYNWDPICDWAEAMSPIVLAFAWLGAGLIVFGWKS